MSVIAQMDGLPINAESNAVVIAVRKILQKLKIRFWVHDFTHSEATDTKKCKIEFFNKTEVPKAIEKLMCKPQTIMGVPCDLRIEILSETSEKDAQKQKLSRSPLSKEEAKLDEEIEQLKKEKEELEKRKSALLRKKMTIDLEGKPLNQMNHTVLPKNTTAENIILEQMKPLVKSLQQKRFYQLLLQRIHVDVRKRLAVLVEENKRLGHKVTTAKDVVKAYRYKHPKAADGPLVDTLLQEIKMSFWAYRAKNADGSKGDGYEYDESSDEENNPPAEKKVRTSEPNDSEKTLINVDKPQELENVDKKNLKNDEPINSENEQTEDSEMKQATKLENEDTKPIENVQPKPTENEQPKPIENEQLKPTENEQPKPTENEQPKPTENEQPKQTENEQPITTENEQPKALESETAMITENVEEKAPENVTIPTQIEEPKISETKEIKESELVQENPKPSTNEESKEPQNENSQDEHLFEGGSDWNDDGTKESKAAS